MRMPQRPPTSRTKAVRKAPESPMATPVTPVAQPLRPAYHFWAQASTAGARKAPPIPTGRLKASRKRGALLRGTAAPARKPPPMSAAPIQAAGRGPCLS